MGKTAEHNRVVSHPFSLLVKPASADCNLRCSYCFYLDKCSLYPEAKIHRMSPEVLDKLVSTYMKTEQPVYAFGWQGGEPTLMGLDFFRKVVELQQRYGRRGSQVSNGLQTNGTLLNDQFAEFLTQYKFLLGVSLDGPQEIHNIYRRNAIGEGTHASVMKGIRCLRRKNTEFNILTLVSSANKSSAREVYSYLKNEGFFYHQYIPCVEWDDKGTPLPWSLTGKDWGRFLLDIFSAWYPSDVKTVSIRHFDSLINFFVHSSYNVCFMGGNCRSYFVVEHGGDVYPCDFFVREDLKIGNIMSDSWKKLSDSPVYARFGAAKSRWADVCSECEYLPYCSGDCLKHRTMQDTDPRSLSALCEGWKLFYKETLPVFKNLAKELMPAAAGQGQGDFVPKRYPDEPCYCGSGKLFRNCHGAKTGL